MRTERGASQVLFGMLPTQTVDLQGQVWQVAYWADPIKLTLDQASMRSTILDAISPWAQVGNDGGLAQDLYARTPIEVVSVNRERGVMVESFPKQWRCRACNRIMTEHVTSCVCGAQSLAQMQFVAYHKCGALREPRLVSCPTHHAVAVRLPGTASAKELYFYCPVCNRKLSQGFPFMPCSCTPEGAKAEGMSVNVHRASAVFSPHYAVLVNPPDTALAAEQLASGGGARALEWVLEGIEKDERQTGSQTVEGFIESLLRQNINLDTARFLAEQALQKGAITQGSGLGEFNLPDATRERAQEEAFSLVSAVAGGRVRISDMVAGTTPPLKTLYESAYQDEIRNARLVDVELLTNFPVATLAFGFTRGETGPGQSTLVPYRDKGSVRAYGILNRTEALLFQLDPLFVYRCLRANGHQLEEANTPREARLAILRQVTVPRAFDQSSPKLGEDLLTIVHSYSHRLIRALAINAGVERDGLSEYLLPYHLSIIVYATARSEFVLGGLQAVFETALDRVLNDFVTGETRCPLDPGCRSGGGACMACLHLGEPSCRWFNRFLDRAALFGEEGYMRIAE